MDSEAKMGNRAMSDIRTVPKANSRRMRFFLCTILVLLMSLHTESKRHLVQTLGRHQSAKMSYRYENVEGREVPSFF
jgi:hypothetical protein